MWKCPAACVSNRACKPNSQISFKIGMPMQLDIIPFRTDGKAAIKK